MKLTFEGASLFMVKKYQLKIHTTNEMMKLFWADLINKSADILKLFSDFIFINSNIHFFPRKNLQILFRSKILFVKVFLLDLQKNIYLIFF